MKTADSDRVFHFLDQSFYLDQQLSLIADLCVAAGDSECVDTSTVNEIGSALNHYLERHRVLKHYFFDAPSDQICESLLIGEIARLEAEGKSSASESTTESTEGENENAT